MLMETVPRSTDHVYLQTVPRPVTAMAKDYPAGYQGYRHTHARAQFLYAASGSMKLTHGQGCWIIPPQRAVWLPADYPHQTASMGELKMRTLYVRSDVWPPDAPDGPRMLRVSPLLRELILRSTEMPVEYDEDGHEGRIVQTLLGEIDWTPLPPVALAALKDPRLRRMEEQLLRRPGDKSTLNDWAERLDLSPRSLSRLFQRELNLSFQAWRDQLRTFAAIPMMADGLPLIEIADALGYETAWSFSSMFKRTTGKVPSKYFSTT